MSGLLRDEDKRAMCIPKVKAAVDAILAELKSRGIKKVSVSNRHELYVTLWADKIERIEVRPRFSYSYHTGRIEAEVQGLYSQDYRTMVYRERNDGTINVDAIVDRAVLIKSVDEERRKAREVQAEREDAFDKQARAEIPEFRDSSYLRVGPLSFDIGPRSIKVASGSMTFEQTRQLIELAKTWKDEDGA